MKTIKKLLYDEARYKMPDGLYDRLLEAMTEVQLKNKEVLIAYGQLDTNVYVHKSGIIQQCWFDGITERTYGFSVPGSVIISYHSFFMRRPSHFQFESCGESTVMKLSKQRLDEMIGQSHEFTQWLLSLSIGQHYFNELKHAVINGAAKERFQALIKHRPDIITRVPLKTIASYLGITPTYLCRLKKNLKEEE